MKPTGLISNYSSGGGGVETPGNVKKRGFRLFDQPASTLTSKCLSMTWEPSGLRLDIREAAKLQGYTFHSGLDRLQIGNAVPPPVAKATFAELWIEENMTKHAVLDLFAGSGVGVACQQLGVPEYGVEKMPAAQETRRLNGMTTVYDDVWDIDKAEGLQFDTLWASPPCFTAGAPVVTERGVVAIEDVVVGDRVLTHMGRWRTVTDTMSREAETVTFGNITSTPDHPFYAATQWRKWDSEVRRYHWGVGTAEWVDAKDTKGKFLSIPISSEEVRDISVPSNLSWWLIGRWLADGWGQSKRGEICIAVGAGKEAEFESHAGPSWKPYQMRSVTR